MSEPVDEGRWQLPDDAPAAEPVGEPAAEPSRGAVGRVVCRVAVVLALLGLPAIATIFVPLPRVLVVLPALGFVLGWLGVRLIDRVDGTGRNLGLVAVRISAVCLVICLAPPLFDRLLL